MPENALTVNDYNPLALMPKNAGEAQQLAKILAESTLIPDHLKKKPGDCLMIVMQSHRWGMDPFVVAQCTSLVHGKMCYEGKLVAAALTSMNAIEGRLTYDITDCVTDGKPDKQVTVTGTPRGGKPQSISGTVLGWRTYDYKRDPQTKKVLQPKQPIPNNWDKDPTSMLVYRGTRQWARLFAPEALLGVYTPEEMDESPITVEAAVSTDVPQRAPAKAAAPIEDAEVTEPATPPPAAAKPAPAAPQQSQPSAPPPSSPAPAPQPQAPAASTGDDLPFGDPNDPDQQSSAPPPPQERSPVQPGPTPNGGPALSETQSRIIKSRREAVGVSEVDLNAAFPQLGKNNINEALAWLESKRQ